jgi:hypothetical protein
MMSLKEMLEWLDGQGLVITDMELIKKTLSDSGIDLDKKM